MMKTDIPLKRLMHLCPTDLLPLFGAEAATVLRVESLELPTGKSSLDCILHLQATDGTPYLHVIEWQGWTDPVLLWRSLSYLGWLGQNRPERPILLTIVYLKPSDDVGDILAQAVTGQAGWRVQVPCVRMWAQDAQQAVASGAPGLLALSPLMQGATAELVETAAQQLVQTTTPPLQAELLTALGVFAEPLITPQRLLRMLTKEQLMSSELLRLVYQEQLEEMEQKEERWRDAMQQSVEHVLMSQFPLAPVKIIQTIRHIHDAKQLQTLLDLILTTDDLGTIVQAITAAADAAAADHP